MAEVHHALHVELLVIGNYPIVDCNLDGLWAFLGLKQINLNIGKRSEDDARKEFG